jgi:4-hydroxythreonine-4-phosphate dehydrogenase
MGNQRPIFITEGDPSGITYELIQTNSESLKKLSERRPVVLLRGNHSLDYHRFLDFQTLALPLPPGTPDSGKEPPSGYRESEFSPSAGWVEPKKDPESFSPDFLVSLPFLPERIGSQGLFECIIPISGESQGWEVHWGHPDTRTGLSSFSCLEFGMFCIRAMGGDLITLPLSKEWVIRAGFSQFRGHTEALGEFFGAKTIMLMKGKKWNIIPLTTHIPLADVGKALEKYHWEDLIQAIKKAKIFSSPLRIGVLGLNPHAGEGGKIGSEELWIMERLREFSEPGMEWVGPISADSAFLAEESSLDLYLACYHDQGLIPFKILEGKTGVNYTLGLDFIRLSPDHGPAYDIAGKGKVDGSSLAACLEFFENEEER